MILFDIYRRDYSKKDSDILVAQCKTETWLELGLLGERLTGNGYYLVVGKIEIPLPAPLEEKEDKLFPVPEYQETRYFCGMVDCPIFRGKPTFKNRCEFSACNINHIATTRNPRCPYKIEEIYSGISPIKGREEKK